MLTAVITVLVGAPVGLLWAALAPHVEVVVEGEQYQVVSSYGDDFIAVDGYYLAAVVLAGVVGGLLAWWLAARHGPAVVVGLTVGGLAAAWVVMAVGAQVGASAFQEVVDAGVRTRRELPVELRATSAIAGWPIASLVVWLLLSVRPRPRSTAPAEAEQG